MKCLMNWFFPPRNTARLEEIRVISAEVHAQEDARTKRALAIAEQARKSRERNSYAAALRATMEGRV